jgi:rod shape determining protein RodA
MVEVKWSLFLPSLCLNILGLFLINSVAPHLFLIQTIFSIISWLVFLGWHFIDHKWLFVSYVYVYCACLLCLISVFFLGEHSRGALRWIAIGGLSLQPSELVKVGLLAVFAQVSDLKIKLGWLIQIGLVAPVLLLIFFQPDLGTVLIVLAGWLSIFVVNYLDVRKLLILSFVALLLVPASWFVLKPYQRDRLITFIDPQHDPLGKGYHVIQSTIAVGSGELFGRGLGRGTQSQLRFLPEQHTDFIFATLSEELGFVGSITVLILYGILLFSLAKTSIAYKNKAYGSLMLGMLGMLAFQVFVNIGMNLGLAPITGVTLPYMSYGGSSLLSMGLILGLGSRLASLKKSEVEV